MMLLKLNKEGPFKKEVFRAPGHAQSMRKLVHFLQQVICSLLMLMLMRIAELNVEPYADADAGAEGTNYAGYCCSFL